VGGTPSRAHGYCLDDAARGLVVTCREPAPSAELARLAERYLAFVLHAQAPDGSFHNRLSYARRWCDRPDTGDWWGRAIWGLGTAIARAPVARLRRDALASFELAVHQRSRWPRAMAFAGLGASEVLDAIPGHAGARRLLADAVITVNRPGSSPDWPWPEPRLSYANASLAEVLLAAGQHLDQPRAGETGLRLLGWLIEVQTQDGHLSTTPIGGWAPGDPRPGFDQLPMEAAAIADACARALTVTGDQRWADRLRLAIDWFLGENDSKVELVNFETGGCRDGLGPNSASLNEGAESTLALLLTLQHARRQSGRSHGS
jgi:hypothetical protein